ncbi:MAG TPA: hypothetical protein PLJ39_14110, partial [Spirochaetota bacterium]|nr:hypothetical protein [Spirochaetota bacterium]
MIIKRISFLIALVFFSYLHSQNLPIEYWKLSTEELSKYTEDNAQLELASRYMTGSNGDVIDINKAHGILNKPELKNNPAAIIFFLISGKKTTATDEELKNVFNEIKKIADRRNPCYQYITAVCYRNGIGTVPDKKQYVNYLEYSVRKEYSPAIAVLGDEYLKGEHIKKNLTASINL